MDRRAFIEVIAGGLLAAAFAAEAQARKVPWVGVLGATPSDPVVAQAFSKGLGDAGYLDGRNVSIEHRHAGGQPDRLPGLALELVRARADVIFARGAGALSATRNATSTIPIVAVDLEGGADNHRWQGGFL
jgi:putative ABC transport system substrate-binding protein